MERSSVGFKKACDPALAVGDGSLGFWKALAQVFPKTKEQRCWVHKTANVLNKLPEKSQAQAKKMLHKIWQYSDTKEDAINAMDAFIALYEDKYPKATECLKKDRKELLTFYDFPAAHWRAIRTTNPIEPAFATVKQRTVKTKGCLSLSMTEIMTFKLIESAEKRWIRLPKSQVHMAEIIRGVKFQNGIAETLNVEDTETVKETRCAA